jgi:tight adherence protein C
MPASSLTSTAQAGLFALAAGVALVLGGAALITSGARAKREVLSRRASRLGRNPHQHPEPPVRKAPTPAVSLVRPTSGSLALPEQREIERRLARLKVPPQYASRALVAIRLVAVVVLGVIAFLAAGHVGAFARSTPLTLLVATGFSLAGWFLPAFVLRSMVKTRAKAVADGLPDALELLIVCVEAGLSLEDGIDRIIGELERAQPALAEELALTSADLKILPSRDQALANLAERVDMPTVRSLVATLSQTLRYGTPLAQALRVVAAELRNEALINLEERANRLPAIMTVPMMLFIMPSIFLIVGGPAALRLMDTFLK